MNRRKAEQWLSMAMDGELSPDQEARLKVWLDQHPEGRELQQEWTQYRSWINSTPQDGIKTPEAARADVERAIRRTEDQPVPLLTPWKVWATASLVLLLILGGIITWGTRKGSFVVAQDKTPMNEVEWVETDLPNASPMVYQDQESGWTVIWVMVDEEESG